MKVLIWLVCILVYSAAVSALNLAGVGLGGIPVVLLSILLIFLPAPALCRLLDRRRQRRQDAAADPPAPAQERRPFPVEKVLISFVVLFVIVACSLQSYHAGVDKGMLSAEGRYQDGMEVGYENGYDAGYDAGRSSCEQETSEELSFYRNNAVLVTLGGERYHHWGCYHLNGRQYLIYNIELAEIRGYTPCLDCWESALQ